MDVLRIASRKTRQDGVSSLLSEAMEEVVREKALRRYIDSKVDYDADSVTVNALAAKETLDDTGHVTPAVSRLPIKQSVFPDDDVRDVSTSVVGSQICGVLRDATVLAPSGLVRTPDGRYVSDSVGPTHLVSRRISVALSKHGYEFGVGVLQEALSNPATTDPATKVDEAIALMPLWSNYFHWTVEGLLKLYWAEWYAEKTGRRPKILVPAGMSSWMRESLALLGVEESDLISVASPRVHVDRLILPSHVVPIPEYTRWIRERASDSLDQPHQRTRIYISRADATRRRVTNEDEVVSTLRSRGFESYALQELTVREQLQLFANAEAVVGPHGAGFANLVYSSDPLVVELFGRKRLNTYHRLAAGIGLRYEPIYCEARGTDLVVDTSKLTATLHSFLD